VVLFAVDQYDNAKNPEAHYLSTGPEIWAQMEGKIDWFVASGSTGGTVTGIGKYLKVGPTNKKHKEKEL
jgi:cystathionine beta-synthase